MAKTQKQQFLKEIAELSVPKEVIEKFLKAYARKLKPLKVTLAQLRSDYKTGFIEIRMGKKLAYMTVQDVDGKQYDFGTMALTGPMRGTVSI